MRNYKFRAVCLLALMPTLASAGEQALQVILSRDDGAQLQLEARQQPLAQILKKMTEATGVPIHYSELPKSLITATCVGPTVKQVLECLFDKKVDLVFRFAQHGSKNVEEVWVMGSNFGAESACTTASIKTQQPVTTRQAKTNDSNAVDKLLKQVQTKNALRRADAVADLAAEGQTNDQSVNSALVSALSDKNPEVRAQAVSGLASRESFDAPVALQNALHDSDASVRLMAVDQAGDNASLLQQALSDGDETVRAYAAIKLEALSGAGKAR